MWIGSWRLSKKGTAPAGNLPDHDAVPRLATTALVLQECRTVRRGYRGAETHPSGPADERCRRRQLRQRTSSPQSASGESRTIVQAMTDVGLERKERGRRSC